MSEDGGNSSDVYQKYSEFYDLYVGDRQVDLPMYKRYATNSGTPILEIGAGSGRLTIPLASREQEYFSAPVQKSLRSGKGDRLENLNTRPQATPPRPCLHIF